MLERLSTLAEKTLHAMGSFDGQVIWESPKEKAHGDFATAVALKAAKQLGKSPKDVAQTILDTIKEDPDVQKAEIAGPGYVNIWLKPAPLVSLLAKTRGSLHPSPKRKEAPVIVDYSSPNIAKPLGIHHILSTVIGQTVTNMYEHAGTPVIRWNYLGDWGTQFGKLAVAYAKWGSGKPAADYSLDELLALYVRFHDEAEKNPALEEEGQEAFRKLESGDTEVRAFWSDVVAVTKRAMGGIYERLHVHFDIDRGESYYEDKMQPIIEEAKRKGVFVPGEKGALIVVFPEETKLPPAVALKGDGATLYLTRDLALMKDRIENFHPASILWAVDVAQKLYFEQLFLTVKQLGWPLPHLEHMVFGRMRFSDKAMSTRKGNILKLEHVLDEAVARATDVIKERGESIQTDEPEALAEMMGVGALVYGILSQNRKMDLVFDWDKMLSFDGNSAPYLMYTHARCRSVIRKSEAEAPEMPSAVDSLEEEERLLIGTLLKFPAVLDEARTEHLPHKLANYLFELSQEANTFYTKVPILKAEGKAKELRLSLTALTADVLRAGAEILTLRLPDAM